jgi:hypothetical protein
MAEYSTGASGGEDYETGYTQAAGRNVGTYEDEDLPF